MRSIAVGAPVALAAALVLSSSGCSSDSRGQGAGRPDDELARKVEELMPRIEELSRLPVRHVPSVRRSSSENLEAYLLERLDAEYPGDSLENMAAAYKAFGLIPQALDVRELLVDLLLEQTLGFYDPGRDVLFVRDEAQPELLDAVVVHELVHALQDQRADLDSLTRSVAANDARSAIHAAMEGHAMVAMMAYQLAEATGSEVSPEGLPELNLGMAGSLADPAQYPQLAEAPAIVRDPLLFAYLGGGRYVQRLWRSQPSKPPPFDEWLPESTEQLLHTERLLVERDSPTPLRLGLPGDGWAVAFASDLGELEMRIYFEEHLGDRRSAAAAAEGWDGDSYALLRRGSQQALVWYTVWDSESDGEEFVDAYRRAFAARFGLESAAELVGSERQARLETLRVDGRPLVRIIETPLGIELEAPPEVIVGSGVN